MNRPFENRQSAGVQYYWALRVLMTAVTTMLLLPIGAASAVTRGWNTGSGNWNVAGNWTPSGVPGAGDTASIVFAYNFPRTVTYNYTGPAVTLSSVTVDLINGNGETATLSISANNLTSAAENVGLDGIGTINQTGGTNTCALHLGRNSGSTGTYILAGGLFTATGHEFVGESGTGTFTQTAGTNATVGNNFIIGVSSGSTGTYNLGGTGALSITGIESVGSVGTGTFNQTGGTNTINSGQHLFIGESGLGIGTYNLSGGSAAVSGNVYVGGGNLGAAGKGVLAVSGTGLLTVSGTLVAFNTAGSGINLSGGTINAAALNFNGTPALFTTGWTGGTLNLTSNVTWDSAAAATTTSGALGPGLALATNQTLKVTGNETLGGVGVFSLVVDTGSTHYVTGTLTLSPAGTITQNSGSTLYAATFTQAGGTVNGTLQNQGNFIYQSGSFNGRLLNQGTVSLGPSFIASNGIENDASITVALGQTLTLDGAGLDNEGTFALAGGTVSGAGPLVNNSVLTGHGTLAGAGGFTNNSSVTVSGGILTLSNSGTNTNTGQIEIPGGQQLRLTGGDLANSGTINLTGGAIGGSAALNNTTGIISGHGTIASPLTNTGLLVADSGILNLTAAFTNSGEIFMAGGVAALNGGTLSNTGLIRGDGIIANNVTNNSGGEIRAEAGKRIKLSGANGVNAGNVNLQGGTAEFSQPLTVGTGGQINGQGTLIIPAGQNTGLGANQTSVFGLADNGTIQFAGGNTNIYGSVNLPGVTNMSGTITGPGTGKFLIGAGANTVSFYGDVWNNGNLFRTAAGSYAVFFGTVHGASSFSGGGTVDFEGTYLAGNSPAAVGMGGNAVFGVANTLDLDIGGTTAGNAASNYAQVNIAGSANLGGTLNLIPYNGFVPVSGDKFTVMTYASASGTFSSIAGTNPAPGLTYSAVYLPNSLVIVTTTAGDKTWSVDASGNSSLGANWLGGVAPGGIGDSATFSTIITANRMVTIDADTTVGTLKFDNANNYTIAGPHTLTLQAAGTAAATINVVNTHGNGAHTISAPITLASDLSITQNSAGAFTLAAALNDAAGKTITTSGPGVTAITGSVNLGNSTMLTVNSGTFRFALASGSATIGSGVQAAVNGSATLELAGSVSALSSGSNRVNILNNSPGAPGPGGLLVSGTNQVVGNIDGPGTTQINAGSDLTANHIIQNALVIGGAAGNPATVTIAASDSSGNPLAESTGQVRNLNLAGSLTPSSPFDAGFVVSAGSITATDSSPSGSVSMIPSSAVDGSSMGGSPVAIPEPSTLILSGLAGLVVALATLRWRPQVSVVVTKPRKSTRHRDKSQYNQNCPCVAWSAR